MILDKIKFLKLSNISCYFITGTGRCGTMLVSRLLSLGKNTCCEHERSILYNKMKPAYLTGNIKPLYKEIETVIEPLVVSHKKRGLIYGESSGLLYLVFDELYRRFGKKARFILLTRHPEGFVRSALARGYFDTNHPYGLEHLRAKPTTEIGKEWELRSPFEKCLWYWNLVNGMIYTFFQTLPRELWKIQPIEKLDLGACRDLYTLLRIKGFNEEAIKELLAKKINVTPSMGNEHSVNPWSVPATLGDRSTWSKEQHQAFERWTSPYLDILYPKDELSNKSVVQSERGLVFLKE